MKLPSIQNTHLLDRYSQRTYDRLINAFSTLTASIKDNNKSDEIEPDLPVVYAEVRGKEFSRWRHRNDKLRELGKIPALLVCMPDGQTVTQQMLAINTTHFHRVIKTVGGNSAFMSHVLNMKIEDIDKEYRVLPRQLRLSNENFKPNNATFRVLNKKDIIRVNVPVKVTGEDTSPGLKQNGFPLLLKYSLPVKCRGDNIPSYLVADVSLLELNGKVFAKDITLPQGCELLNVDGMICVCKISPFK